MNYSYEIKYKRGKHPNSTHIIHGMTTHNSQNRIYRIWRGMKIRCFCKKSPSFKNYGGRGISMCEKWHKFKSFYEDMKDGYSDKLTLERIDVNGNYCKENCRWATYLEQGKNKRYNAKFEGEMMRDISEKLGGKKNLVQSRIYQGWSIERAVTTPVTFHGRWHKKTNN